VLHIMSGITLYHFERNISIEMARHGWCDCVTLWITRSCPLGYWTWMFVNSQMYRLKFGCLQYIQKLLWTDTSGGFQCWSAAVCAQGTRSFGRWFATLVN